MTNDFLIYGENICAYPHILGNPSSYLTLHLIPSEFPYIWGKFCFLFYQCSNRDMAMRRIFWGFCRNWFLIDPLHYLTSRSDFGFEFAEIFVIEKRLGDSASRWLSESVSQSATLRLGESGSRWFADSASRGVDFWMFKRKLGESESRRLPGSASRGVANSSTRRVGESSTPRLGEPGSRYGIAIRIFLTFFIKLQHFKRLNSTLKGQLS